MPLEMKSTPTIVLDDECLNTKDLSCSLMGRVKEFTSLSNLKKVLCNEGFDVLKMSYLGELWVLIEFESAKVKDLFKENGKANSWFSVLNQASEDFTMGGRIAWVEVEGIPFKLWSEEEEDDVSVEDNHGEIHSDQEINNCNDESDVEEVPETCFIVPKGQKGNPSEYPFGIYPLLNKDKNIMEHKINEEESSLKHPPGFTSVGNLNEGHLDGGCAKKVNEEVARDDNSFVHTVGGLVQKAKKDWVKELCIKNKVNFVGLQETKMESIDLLSVSSCWGNLMFDYVHSDSVGNSGGILCMWDPNSFCKSSYTRSDYFVIIRGLWLKSGIKLMIVVVYAPQEASEKRMLWDYLTHVSDQWDGEIVRMGDFNE
nr:nucleotide-binding alpha-beta plait domain-containing protein [Tanacetum cinerariifolium]